jgi:TfoX/Sxy family transcriptional regulator of competence genes
MFSGEHMCVKFSDCDRLFVIFFEFNQIKITMAYNEFLADRVRQSLDDRKVQYRELKMMGGLCYMVDDKMCIGIVKDDLMVRLDPESDTKHLAEPGARPMDFTGKRMKGYYFIDADGYDFDEDLDNWVERCLDFNPFAKASKS